MDDKIYDIIIVGCGPAGMSAAVNAKIRNKSIKLLGGDFCTPTLHKAPWVDNYLGFSNIKGEELRERFLQHLKDHEITIENRRVDTIYPMGETFQIMSKADIFHAKSVIIATGLSAPKYLPGEKGLVGRGVGYCATCDGPLYKGKDVIIIGQTHEAEEEANFLAEIVNKVSYIPLYREIQHIDEKVQVVMAKPKSIKGDQHFSSLETDQGEFSAHGLFIIRGVTPVNEILPGLELERSTVKVNRQMATNVPGVYAAGDCTGQPYQLAKAVGEGLTAALSAAKLLDQRKSLETAK